MISFDSRKSSEITKLQNGDLKSHWHMSSESPQLISHSRDSCRFVIFFGSYDELLRTIRTNSDKIGVSRWSSVVTTISTWRRKSSHWIGTRGREDDDPEKNCQIHLLCIRVGRFSSRCRLEKMWQERRWVLERMEFFYWTRSIHYADGYVSVLIELMYRGLVLKMKDREFFR